jgi:nifR3 family TIM-barrel protein
MIDSTLITELNPIRIGNLEIDPPLTLAPMAGQTNRGYRELVREVGDCGLVCTELLSSHAIHYKSKKTFKMFDWDAEESPFAVQLFGSDPAMMAEAAEVVAEHGADIVDLNMGCWVPKVAKKNGAGAALLKDVCAATAVVKAMVDAVDVPVTVKIRAGWEPGQMTAVEFAKAAEGVGVQAIAVHARYASQGFTGEPDWDIIRQVKEAVNIPVMGNGDVTTADEAARMFRETGCDAIMIGRGALGKPWIFRHIRHALQTGEILPEPSPQEKAAYCLQHARLSLRTTNFEEIAAVRELRGQLTKYAFGIPGAAQLRDGLVRCESLADIEAILLPLVDELEALPA